MEFIKVKIDNVDEHNYLHPKYGGNADAQYLNEKKLSVISPKISWSAVAGAKSYALECIDYDAAPVAGMIFIHWVVANIKTTHLEEDASRLNQTIIQGVNSSTKATYFAELSDEEKHKLNLKSSGYVGPRPPNCDHHYKFIVYALDIEMNNLQQPFFINQMHDLMRDHVIGIGFSEVKYKQVK